ncbi:L,D-transpeptidase [Bosea sp. 124]|uniref:L,D-transpeptidase n=1 Tax=Bosea sp. 124 TaxID=2135642 RepID=UPI000D361D23|nr:L,D-transpeptidase [Bosea sp. 124]PTM41578.1 lipoprotein-anchoring transpeptidase ErfK/SrfK [Bosea sp. 124]
MSSTVPPSGRERLLRNLKFVGLLAAALSSAGCSLTQSATAPSPPALDPQYVALYGEIVGDKHVIAATDISVVDDQFLRREVAYDTREQPGTVIIDTEDRFLYLVRENGRAIRYGIGVGADGMNLSGRTTVGRKAVWPSWTPTLSMIKRDPIRNAKWAKGMAGGVNNPLGPRALYLYIDGRDTLYRIHGTTEPHTIGDAVSSGCIRLLNQDIMDLFNRVPVGATVVIAPRSSTRSANDSIGSTALTTL